MQIQPPALFRPRPPSFRAIPLHTDATGRLECESRSTDGIISARGGKTGRRQRDQTSDSRDNDVVPESGYSIVAS